MSGLAQLHLFRGFYNFNSPKMHFFSVVERMQQLQIQGELLRSKVEVQLDEAEKELSTNFISLELA